MADTNELMLQFLEEFKEMNKSLKEMNKNTENMLWKISELATETKELRNHLQPLEEFEIENEPLETTIKDNVLRLTTKERTDDNGERYNLMFEYNAEKDAYRYFRSYKDGLTEARLTRDQKKDVIKYMSPAALKLRSELLIKQNEEMNKEFAWLDNGEKTEPKDVETIKKENPWIER